METVKESREGWRECAYSLESLIYFMGKTVNFMECHVCFYSPRNPVKLVLFLS